MKSSFVFFLVLLAQIRSYGVISIDIFPAANGQATFQISGQFNGPVAITGPNSNSVFNLSAFAFAPDAAMYSQSSYNYYFSPSLATVTNVTRGGSSTIYEFDFADYYPTFDLQKPLPIYNGDVLSLVPNGPATVTIYATGAPLPYTAFVPGDYTFNDALLDCTFAVHVIPEPSLNGLAGIGALALISMRRRTLCKK